MSERLRRKNILPALFLCLGLVACGSRPVVAQQTPTPSPKSHLPPIGYDVSYPQCGQQLPGQADFAVIGVNGTVANTFNPCLAAELAWARRIGIPPDKIALYVHVAEPGDGVADWPKSGSTPYGNCDGGDTEACSYEYGKERADGDIGYLQSIQAAPAPKTIYLDVETDYSWDPDTANNRAAMEGMTGELQRTGATVGTYSDAAQWEQIAGTVPPDSSLYALPVWLLGARSVAGAEDNCKQPSFTVGPVVLTQILGGPLDMDVACR